MASTETSVGEAYTPPRKLSDLELFSWEVAINSLTHRIVEELLDPEGGPGVGKEMRLPSENDVDALFDRAVWTRPFADNDDDYDKQPAFHAAYAAADAIVAHIAAELLRRPEWLAELAAEKARASAADLIRTAADAREEA